MTTLTPPPQKVPESLKKGLVETEFFTRLKTAVYYLFEDHQRLNTDILNALQPVKGFVLTRDSATELTFSSGSVTVSSGIYTRSSSIQKILGTTWAEGDAVGGEFSGATIGNTDDYYAIAISKDSSPSTVDIGFDDNASGTNKPTGWTVLKEVFRGMTNSSGQIDAKTVTETAGGGLYVELDVAVREFADNSTGTSRVDKTLTQVPPDTEADLAWTGIDNGGHTGAAAFLFTRESQTDTAPGVSIYHLRVFSDNTSTQESANSVRWRIKTNASRVVCYRSDTSDANLFIECISVGYYLERR